MSNPNSIQNEISQLTASLIGAGLCSDQNWPSLKPLNHSDGQIHTVSIDGVDDLSITLKNIDYFEIYRELRSRRSYNLNMVDGGLIQFLYTFQNDSLIKHRLSFFPSPDLLEFQNNPDVYETDVLYSEVIDKGIVPSPVRFDYDPDNFSDYHHPRCHLTIGQYKNCRIPVSSPFTPFQFLNFILRAFYNTSYNSYCSNITPISDYFDNTITALEESLPHFRSLK